MHSVEFTSASLMQMGGKSYLMLELADTYIAKAFLATIEAGKRYIAELGIKRKKRSLDANAYFWSLAGKLAAKLQISPDEVYRQYIHDIGGNYVIQPIKPEQMERWERIWCAGHIGRMVEDMGECRNLAGFHNVRCYIGSSDYDTAQMSRLLTLIVDDCKTNGIDTATPEELARLKEAWR